MTTPLHAALGMPGAELTFDLVEEACQQKLTENDQLDWKRSLPLPVGGAGSEEELHNRTHELAKDIAAMANTRGGLLVYGVREGSANCAEEVVDVGDLSGGEMAKRIRQVSSTYVYPPVQVRCHPLTSDPAGQGAKRVLVVEVPESEEAPHLVRPRKDGGNQGWLIAPYRDGPDTSNMVEKQIETAYKQRLDGRQARHRSLREMHAELVERRAGHPWHDIGTVVVLAQPLRPRRGPLAGDDTRQKVTARSIVWSAATFNTILTNGFSNRFGRRPLDGLGSQLFADFDRPKRSLRRHVFTTGRWSTDDAGRPVGTPADFCVELHDDATIGLTWRRGTFHPAIHDDWVAPTFGAGDMDMVAIALFALVLAVSRDMELGSDYQVRVSIVPAATLRIVPDDTDQATDASTVPTAPAIEAELRLTATADVLASDVLTLAQDLNHMIEQPETVFERFWESTAFFSETPMRDLARQVFGGEPDHPLTGAPMTRRR